MQANKASSHFLGKLEYQAGYDRNAPEILEDTTVHMRVYVCIGEFLKNRLSDKLILKMNGKKIDFLTE